jgi:DNA helicase-4
LTIHRSKGSKADYVILAEMLTVLRGRSFSSTRTEDPVLGLAIPPGDDYPASEERRLFYVALTRARRTVALFTAQGRCSSLLKELEADGAVTIQALYGQPNQEESYPACRQGAIILKTGRHGPFRSCSNFPICKYKPKKKGGSRTGPRS